MIRNPALIRIVAVRILPPGVEILAAAPAFQATPLSNRAPSLNHSDNQDDQSDHQENVDVPIQCVGCHHSKSPHHQQNHEYRHQHLLVLPSIYFRRLRSNRSAKRSTCKMISRETLWPRRDLTNMEGRFSVKNILLASGIGLLLMGAVSAQETPRFTFNVGAGFTQPVGATGKQLNDGWNLGAGVGYNFHPRFGALVQFSDTRSDINTATLNTLGFPGGNVNVWSLTLDPIVHTNPRGPVDLYFIGGGGLYNWRQEFTEPGIGTFTGFDPFFGFFQAEVPTTNVLSSYSVN